MWRASHWWFPPCGQLLRGAGAPHPYSLLEACQLASRADDRRELLGLLGRAEQPDWSLIVEAGVRAEKPCLGGFGVVRVADHAHDVVAVAQALRDRGPGLRTIRAGVAPDLLSVRQTHQEGRHPLAEPILQIG